MWARKKLLYSVSDVDAALQYEREGCEEGINRNLVVYQKSKQHKRSNKKKRAVYVFEFRTPLQDVIESVSFEREYNVLCQ